MPVREGLELAWASAAGHIASLALPIMALQLYDRLLLPHQPGTLPMLAFGVCTALVLENIILQLRARLMALASASYEHQTETGLFSRLLRERKTDTASHRHQIGEDIQMFQFVQRCKRQAGGENWVISTELLFAVLYMAFIAWLAWPLAWVVAGLSGIFASAALLTGLMLKSQIIKRNHMENERLNNLWEMLQQWHSIKAMTLEAVMLRKCEDMHIRNASITDRLGYITAMMSGISGLTAQATMLAVVLAGTPHVLSGTISAGALIACVMLSGRVMPPIQHAVQSWLHWQETTDARESLRSTTKQAEQSLDAPKNNLIPANGIQGNIICQNLDYGYNSTDKLLLKKLDFRAPPGACIAIVGGHSSGKTTFLKLLSGLLVPSSGQVQIDGVSPYGCLPSLLPKLVGYIAGEGVVLRGSIMENMCAFNPSLQDNARELATLLGLDHIAARLPQGYQTLLTGEDADVVPPGVRQRIAIVRALAHKPRTILLDHADRSLDPAGYNATFRLLGLLKGKATIIMVTEDQNLLRLAESILLLEDGGLHAAHTAPNLTLVEGGRAA
jgi:ATP-binding cassette subfamily C protein LapB